MKQNPTTTICPMCESDAVTETTVRDTAEMVHDGTVYRVSAEVPALVCASCSEKFFDFRADRLMRRALRQQLGLLQPEDIKTLRDKYDLTQERVAELTSIAATTISRWETSHVIQSKASDDHLRRFFDDMEAQIEVSEFATVTCTTEFQVSIGNFFWPEISIPQATNTAIETQPTTQYALAA